MAENVFLGRQPVGRFGLVDRRRMQGETARLLGRLGVELDPGTPLGELPMASRQLVAIARAVSSSARVLVFDEPTTSLTQRESDLLFAAIRRLRADGIGIVYVSHRMEEIFDLCDRVTVLRDGRHVATRRVAETDLAGLIGDDGRARARGGAARRGDADGADRCSRRAASDGAASCTTSA